MIAESGWGLVGGRAKKSLPTVAGDVDGFAKEGAITEVDDAFCVSRDRTGVNPSGVTTLLGTGDS